MTRYSDIIARLESASGPDRELSIAVGAALGAVEKHFDVGDGDAETWWEFQDGERLGHVTASLDAAIGLVERVLVPRHPHMTVNSRTIYDAGQPPYCFFEITWPSHERQGRSRVPAIALLLALFRALEAQEAGE